MRILIIENTWMGGARYGFFDKLMLTAFSILPTLYARQIAAITPHKHNVRVLTERYDKIDFDEDYDIVNINFTTSTTSRAYEIADKFREKGVTVVLSGLHPSGNPDEVIEHADSVLLGRGELNWLELLDDFEKNSLKKIYQPVKPDSKTRFPPTNIDLPGFVLTGAIEATRGCPYRCSFCPDTNIPGGSFYYKRPVDEVIEEIKSLPQKTLMFYDASLTIDKEYTKSLFKKMKGLNKKFFCNGNLDVLADDEEFVKLSKEAGCVAWLVGFESVSQKTLDDIGKKTNKVKEYRRTVENIHNNKMIVIGCFMFGFDTETKDIFNDTLKVIDDLEIDVADFCVVTPFPGTPFFDNLEKQGRILTKDWSKYNLKNVVFQPKNMTKEELENGIRIMYNDFYSTKNTVKRIVRSLRFGLYPFGLVIFRNMVANMNKRLLN